MKEKITIYTTGPQCNRCNALKEAFWRADIVYEEHPLDASVISECLTETYELVTSAPLVKDGHVWHFASDLFDASGNLKANWLVELQGVRPRKEFGGVGGQPDTKIQSSSKIWGSK